MAIYRLLQEASFDPEEIKNMVSAYEHALTVLRLANRSDPLTEMLARKIIEIVRQGERDPRRICARALRELGVAQPD